ncbi:MAG: hypothetical protein GF331_27400 [Chitinivibrionales bacterium]|nr:hypothetical protein [Chitinivibrionales bacterium]
MEALTTFFTQMADRLTGPLSFRFILQPAIAVLLGVRDGRLDAKAGLPPFILDVLIHRQARKQRLGHALRSTLSAIVVGVIVDALAQYLIFRAIYPLQALLVGTVIIALPYAVARGLANRAISLRRHARGGGSRHAV